MKNIAYFLLKNVHFCGIPPRFRTQRLEASTYKRKQWKWPMLPFASLQIPNVEEEQKMTAGQINATPMPPEMPSSRQFQEAAAPSHQHSQSEGAAAPKTQHTYDDEEGSMMAAALEVFYQALL